jgi:hypothetical protein
MNTPERPNPVKLFWTAARIAVGVVCCGVPAVSASAGGPPPSVGNMSAEEMSADMMPLTPEQKMERRFPQPVRVGDLVGLPVYDHDDRTVGHIREVVQTPGGQIRLIVPYGGWFGWGNDLVAVPIETVAILGRHVNALEFTLDDFKTAPVWSPGTDRSVGHDETIRIALSRR